MTEETPWTRIAGFGLLALAVVLFGVGLVIYITGFEVAALGMMAGFAVSTLALGLLAVPSAKR
jgi:hypothetical protein